MIRTSTIVSVGKGILLGFLVVWTDCHYTDMWVWNQCQDKNQYFETKDEMADFVKKNYSVAETQRFKIYDAKPMEYSVSVQTEQRKKEETETVETGRTITFK